MIRFGAGKSSRELCLYLVFALLGGFTFASQGAAQTTEERLKQLEDKYDAQQLELQELKQSKGQGQGSSEALDFAVKWKNGLRFEFGPGPTFVFKINGRINNDWAFFDGDRDIDAAFDPEDGTRIRRARVSLSGQLYENIEWKAQYEFAGGDADFADLWIGLKGLPCKTTVRIGHQREPFSLDEQTSSLFSTFVERALPLTSDITGGRNTGVRAQGRLLDERLNWSTGVFRPTDSFGNGSDNGKYAVTSRVAGLPYVNDDGDQLVHLGFAYSRRKLSDSGQDFGQRPESSIPSEFVNTGTLMGDAADVFGCEAALVFGPFSVQAEMVNVSLEIDGASDAHFHGHYIFASYFLTGEHRPYKRSSAAFGRVKPKKNFSLGKEKGTGAIEVAARYSALDLNARQVRGGEIHNYTAGVSWYLNPFTRVTSNFVRSHRRGIGQTNILEFRFQVDF